MSCNVMLTVLLAGAVPHRFAFIVIEHLDVFAFGVTFESFHEVCDDLLCRFPWSQLLPKLVSRLYFPHKFVNL